MLKADLLPRANPTASLFGLSLNLVQARDAFVGAFTGSVLAAILVGGFNFRLQAVQSEENALETQISATAEQRAEIGTLVSDVQSLQKVDRDAAWLRVSGQLVALRLVQLGNALPRTAWLDDIAQSDSGWRILGGAPSLAVANRALAQIAKASPGLETTFVRIGNDHHFEATIKQDQAFTFSAPAVGPGPGAANAQPQIPDPATAGTTQVSAAEGTR